MWTLTVTVAVKRHSKCTSAPKNCIACSAPIIHLFKVVLLRSTSSTQSLYHYYKYNTTTTTQFNSYKSTRRNRPISSYASSNIGRQVVFVVAILVVGCIRWCLSSARCLASSVSSMSPSSESVVMVYHNTIQKKTGQNSIAHIYIYIYIYVYIYI